MRAAHAAKLGIHVSHTYLTMVEPLHAYAGDLQGPRYVQALAVKLLLRWSLAALTSADSAVREVASRAFLPVLGIAAGRLGSGIGQLALQAVWEQCR